MFTAFERAKNCTNRTSIEWAMTNFAKPIRNWCFVVCHVMSKHGQIVDFFNVHRQTSSSLLHNHHNPHSPTHLVPVTSPLQGDVAGSKCLPSQALFAFLGWFVWRGDHVGHGGCMGCPFGESSLHLSESGEFGVTVWVKRVAWASDKGVLPSTPLVWAHFLLSWPLLVAILYPYLVEPAELSSTELGWPPTCAW